MSYADTLLDWRSVHVACLSGRNGAGKSAILDAITWALWECARGSSDDLIRLGQTEMWVDVRIAVDGQEYRVRRSRSRNSPRPGGKMVSKGTLELQMLQKQSAVAGISPMHKVSDDKKASADKSFASKEKWISLTAPTMRETQVRICELLKMQYDTFINSVYLRQGRADEFTQRSAGDRKEVLAEILGLGYFDRLQDLARDEARTRKARLEQLQASTPDLLIIEQERRRLEAELQTVTATTGNLLEQVATSQADVDRCRNALDDTRQAAKMLAVASERLTELQRDLHDVEVQRAELTARQTKFEKLLANAAHLDAEQARYSSLSESVQALDKAALAVHDLLEARQTLRSSLAATRGRMEVELDHLREQVAEVSTKRKKLKRDTKEQKKIEAAYSAYKALVAEEAMLNRQQELHATLLTRAEQLQSMITEARMRLDSDIQNKELLLVELQTLIESKQTLESEQQLLLVQAKDLDRVDAEFSLVEEKGMRIKSEIESLQSEIRELRRRCGENEEKRAELQHQSHSSTCPLCSSPIVDRAAVAKRYADQNAVFEREISDLENRVARFEDERDALRTQYTELRKLLISRKMLDQKIGEYNERQAAIVRAEVSLAATVSELERLRERLAQQEYAQVERESLINIKTELHKLDFDPIIYSSIQSQLRSQRQAEIRYHQLQKDLQALADVDVQLPLLEQHISDFANQLRDDTFGTEIRDQLNEVEKGIAHHDYDQAQHSLVREQLSSLMPNVELFRELGNARRDLPQLQTRQAELEQTAKLKNNQIAQLESDSEGLRSSAAAQDQLQQELDVAVRDLRALQEQHARLSEQRGSLAAQIEHLNQQMETMQDKQTELRQTIDEMNDFLQLAEAFGKKGIQALIIENAIPELESEANRLLSRLTENQMHVGLITQQRNKQGNAIETLDIVIADEVGTRNYEMFSGGEAFKVNFALRLALSRLLARRAGAKLETLIIDEGFGTQDEESRHKLLNSINMVSADFARIIVVSHIAEVREMFPTQIVVQKESGISSAQIVH